MKKMIFATNNNGKLAEITPLLTSMAKDKFNEEFKILTFQDLGVDIDIEEGTESLYINSAKKAKEAHEALIALNIINKDDIVVSEDSGLFGEYTEYPGVSTKREIQELGVDKVIQKCKLKNVNNDNEIGFVYYKSVISFYSDNVQMITHAIEKGSLLNEPTGNYNYPLDKHFMSYERGPLGQLTPEDFSKTSFRQNATEIKYSKEIFSICSGVKKYHCYFNDNRRKNCMFHFDVTTHDEQFLKLIKTDNISDITFDTYATLFPHLAWKDVNTINLSDDDIYQVLNNRFSETFFSMDNNPKCADIKGAEIMFNVLKLLKNLYITHKAYNKGI